MASHALFLVKAREIMQKVQSQAKEEITRELSLHFNGKLMEQNTRLNKLAEREVRESRSETLKEIEGIAEGTKERFRCAACDGSKCEHTQCCQAIGLILTRIQELKK